MANGGAGVPPELRQAYPDGRLKPHCERSLQPISRVRSRRLIAVTAPRRRAPAADRCFRKLLDRTGSGPYVVESVAGHPGLRADAGRAGALSSQTEPIKRISLTLPSHHDPAAQKTKPSLLKRLSSSSMPKVKPLTETELVGRVAMRRRTLQFIETRDEVSTMRLDRPRWQVRSGADACGLADGEQARTSESAARLPRPRDGDLYVTSILAQSLARR